VSSIDIHELERLIGMGCPPETTHLSLVARTPVLKSFSRRPFESDPLSLCRI
jgi:hypothetical protein